jgi:hypothetical protein
MQVALRGLAEIPYYPVPTVAPKAPSNLLYDLTPDFILKALCPINIVQNDPGSACAIWQQKQEHADLLRAQQSGQFPNPPMPPAVSVPPVDPTVYSVSDPDAVMDAQIRAQQEAWRQSGVEFMESQPDAPIQTPACNSWFQSGNPVSGECQFGSVFLFGLVIVVAMMALKK